MINTLKRRELIIDQLCREGSVRVEQLSAQFSVSSVTIRSDLRQLEKSGCAVRAYGGAMLNKQFAFDRPLQDKGRLNRDVKYAIACAAAELVNDGDAIILDSGSTTSQMAQQLVGKKDLVVMTNALNIAFELANNEQVDLMVVGGSVRRKSWSLYGPAAEQHMRQFRFDKLFLGVDGFDLQSGITTPDPGEAQLNRAMCDVAREVIAVADASKFGRTSFCMIREIGQIQRLVTDSRIPESYLHALNHLGVDVIIADR
ncbi:Glycerol-3-phosphate regulon repressor [Serratia quinivorans]|jgi:DeoR family transcriptional regulator, aga operon transcriptional repressor|uniref:transcriptional repressor AgaR n=1 Tax=Serratia quinivorans TaxID=137545 RepID=UPI000D99ECE1|nr:transcriptional repressor AgaR [Serratia quinivorans]MBV6691516.1 DeoR/GlpR family DNA-binding transcription regulator [Serratia quinivorans]CAI0694275.1 Glycerol-3-phosphate regulon repressor [Serratia quinivorans]CAI1611331.1 Glycerol-3-phosphate regulon repressor [Serratia quinivorans]CAI1649907.1 Glycerol-3-phosphate regulon repressor [Serratia quinivorans]CAI1674050.1 Glycerol-3-phosphate regulon repressor [Serratia quinivorans]